MAPSDSQHPEIGVREERRRRTRRWGKQSKTNIEATLHRHGLGLGRQVTEGGTVERWATGEEELKRETECECADFTEFEISTMITQRLLFKVLSEM